jgi:NADH-quinone oxidoreductase subunit H
MKFAMFFLGEYTHVITISFLVSVMFFGGWHFPGIATPDSNYALAWLVKWFVLLGKVALSIVLIILLRWTLPRFRFDQLMGLAWKVLIPLAMANVICVMTVKQFNLETWWLFPASLLMFIGAGVISTTSGRAALAPHPHPAPETAAGGH